MIAVQNSFAGGIDLISSDTNIGANNYQWLINARQRFGFHEAIKKHVKDTNVPSGIKQGLIAVNDVLIAFIAGQAFTKTDGSDFWVQIPGFIMSVDAPQYWTCAVPASTFSFVRKSISTNIQAPINVTTDFKVSGTPQGIVVQDGVSQPWLILFDTTNQIFTARRIHTYLEWANVSVTTNDREYVPIGKQMMYQDGILYVVAPDSKSVYRSVTGRPLDFMINVDSNGHKAASESQGGASSVSFAMDFDEITCIMPVTVPSSFILATARNTRIVTADTTNTIFGEPTFYTSAIIDAGVVNQYSVVEILGDLALVDKEGIKLFNAVKQLRFRGRNTSFSQNVSKLLQVNGKLIKQTIPICIAFDDYALFNLDTKYGNMFLIYDMINNNWVGFDITLLTRVKQFAIVETATVSKLYAIDRQDNVWQMFASLTREVAMLKTKAFTAYEPTPEASYLKADIAKTSIEHKSQSVRALFNGGTYDGTVTLMELVDDQESLVNRETKTMTIGLNGIDYPVRPPVGPSNNQRVDNPSWSLTRGLTGKKITLIFVWDNDSQFVEYELVTQEFQAMASQKQQNQTFVNKYVAS